MQKGNSVRRFVSIGVALVALVALTVSLGAGAAGAGTGHAVAAKKKCKKHKKYAASAKKKCKKKKVVPVVLPAPGPLVRGTLSWGDAAELDLHAFDANGSHSGWVTGAPGHVEDLIPNATHSPDAFGPATESFTDNIFVQGGPSNREFSYAVCFYDDASAIFTGVTRTGLSDSVPLNYVAPAEIHLTTPGGPPVPASFSC